MTLNVANLDRLIFHLERVPEKKFHMRELFKGSVFRSPFRVPQVNECGTVACIAGHCAWVAGVPSGSTWDGNLAADWIGIDWNSECELFTPPGFTEFSSRYPLPRALRTLKHMRSEFLRTGEIVVDWDAPEPVEKPAWAAPKAVERVLPDEIVNLLRPAQRAEVSA